jgi:hypothetical protein
MKLGLKTIVLALVVALLCVPAALAKGPGGHGQGKPSWAGQGKPSWAGGGGDHGKANAPGQLKKSQQATQQEVTVQQDEPKHDNPAWNCKFERDNSDAATFAESDAATFAEKYGTNENDANAFGMCVSEAAQAQGDTADDAAPESCDTAGDTSEDDTSGDEATSDDSSGDVADDGSGDVADDGSGDVADECQDDGSTEEPSAEEGDSADDDQDEETDEQGDETEVAALARALVRFIKL